MCFSIEIDQLQFFSDLTIAQKEMLFPLFTPCHFTAGDVIFEQGDQAEHLYLVVKGEVAVRFKPEDGPPIIVARVQPEGMVGWSAALGRDIYTSSVDCLDDCTMLKVNRNHLRELCKLDSATCTVVLDRLAIVIAERLRNTHEQIFNLLKIGICQASPDLINID